MAFVSSELEKAIEFEKKALAQLKVQVEEQEDHIAKLELQLGKSKLKITFDTFLQKVGAQFERAHVLQSVLRKYPLATTQSKSVTCIEFLDPTHFRSEVRDFPSRPQQYEYRQLYDAFYQQFTTMYADFYSKMCTIISHSAFREHRLDGMVIFAPADYRILKLYCLRVTQYESMQLLDLHEKIFDVQPVFDLVSKQELYDGKDSYHSGFSDLTILHFGGPSRVSRTEKRLYGDICQKVDDRFGGKRIPLAGDVKFSDRELELLKLYKIGVTRVSALSRIRGH